MLIEISDETCSKEVAERIVEFIATGRPMPFANSRIEPPASSKSRIQGVLCRIPSVRSISFSYEHFFFFFVPEKNRHVLKL